MVDKPGIDCAFGTEIHRLCSLAGQDVGLVALCLFLRVGLAQNRHRQVWKIHHPRAIPICARVLSGIGRGGTGREWGYIDKQGYFALPPRFRKGRAFKDGIAQVCDNEQWIHRQNGPIYLAFAIP